MINRVDPTFFYAETALAPSRPCYVEREADADLLKALRAGKFTVILASRKVGKTSLLERAFANLRRENVYVVKKELAEADAVITEEGWYSGLIEELVNDARRRNGFAVDSNWLCWWGERAHLPAGQRFTDFLRTFFLEPTTVPWVIAIDEIDHTILLPFSDDFFAAVRRCQNARAADPLFERLTFLLVGVASPAQLIKDNRRTPFNIGHSVSVTDFTADEAKVLLDGLGEPREANHSALQRVLYWTGGHPFLTQKVFSQLAEQIEDKPPSLEWAGLVDAAVSATFLRPGSRVTETHLQDIARRRIGDLDKPTNPNADPVLKRRMLAIYRRVWNGDRVLDEAQSRPIVELKLCGLIVPDTADPGRLAVRNRIYRKVFDSVWVRGEMPRDRWRQVAIGTTLLAFVSLGIGGVGWRQLRIADLVAQIEDAESDVPSKPLVDLRRYYGQEQRARELLAGYWARRANIASTEQPRDLSAILCLKALSLHERTDVRLQAQRTLSGSLANVLATFRHAERVQHAAFSADGHRVVTASDDCTARVWDAGTGQPLSSPLKHTNQVLHAEFSPNGQRVVTASLDGTAHVWDVETGQSLGSPLKHDFGVIHAEFSLDGQWVVTVGLDGTVRVWDANTGQLRSEPWLKDSSFVHAEFSPDGQRVVTASRDNKAQVWDANTGQTVGSVLKHEKPVYYAEFSPDGQRVVTASADHTARIWNAQTGQPLSEPLRHELPVNHAEFSSDGQRVVTASDDHTAQVWNAATSQPLGCPLKHEYAVVHAEFSADGQRVVTASIDRTAAVWDAKTGQPLGSPFKHEKGVSHAEFSADGQRVVTASYDGTARVWEAKTGKPLGRPLIHDGFARHAAFSPDGPRVVMDGDDHTVRFWDPQTEIPLSKLLPLTDSVRHAEFSPDGQQVVTVSLDGTVRIRDAKTGQSLGSPLKHDGYVLNAKFSVDGKQVVTASLDGTARIWDAKTGQSLGSPLKHDGRVFNAKFSVDGKRVVTASDFATARVWDAETGQALGRPLQHHENVLHAEFSADSRWVVTASLDKTAKVWDAQTGQPICSPLKHDAGVFHAKFSADGLRVVTASEDSTARVWDVVTGQILGSPLKHNRRVVYATFSKDGRWIVTATPDTLTWYQEKSPNVWRPLATVWANGASWKSEPLLLDSTVYPTGDKIRIADAQSGETLLIRDIDRQEPESGLPDLTGTADELLAKYLQRFALKFEDDQKSPTLIPKYPIRIR